MIAKRKLTYWAGFLLLAGVLLLPARGATAADVCASSELDVPATECAALMTLYNATDGPHWIDQTGWGTATAVCDWTGIDCETTAGQKHVYAITLQSNQLSGPLPAQISDLTYLNTLDLYDNFLIGPIPASLGTLPDLTYIELGMNLLQGAIPDPISGSSSPLFLYLSGNALTGAPPASLCTAVLSATLDHNALDTANADACFFAPTSVFVGWELTQTAPPLNVSAEVAKPGPVSANGASATAVTFAWQLPAFTEGQGGYMILSAADAAGPFTKIRKVVQGKESTGATIEVPGPAEGYVFVVRSFSSPGAANKNTLLSAESNKATVGPVAITLLDARAANPLLYVAAAGPLLLLLLTAVSVLALRRR